MASRWFFTVEENSRAEISFRSEDNQEYNVEYLILDEDILVTVKWESPQHVLVSAELHKKDLSHLISSEGNIVNGNKANLLLRETAKFCRFDSKSDVVFSISVTPYVTFRRPTEPATNRYETLELEVEAISSLSKDMQELFLSRIMSDAKISNGQIQIPIHKAILSTRSSVLGTKFSTGYDTCVTIPHISDQALKDFIKFIYCGIFKFRDIKAVLELYKLAYEYEVEELFSICGACLSNVTLDSALDIVRLTDECNDQCLQKCALDFIAARFSDVESSQTWKYFSENHPDTLSQVLSFVANTSV